MPQLAHQLPSRRTRIPSQHRRSGTLASRCRGPLGAARHAATPPGRWRSATRSSRRQTSWPRTRTPRQRCSCGAGGGEEGGAAWGKACKLQQGAAGPGLACHAAAHQPPGALTACQGAFGKCAVVRYPTARLHHLPAPAAPPGPPAVPAAVVQAAPELVHRQREAQRRGGQRVVHSQQPLAAAHCGSRGGRPGGRGRRHRTSHAAAVRRSIHPFPGHEMNA